MDNIPNLDDLMAMDDLIGRGYLENQTIGRDYIEFKNWPKNTNFNLAVAKHEWLLLRRKYLKMMKLGEEVVKLLEK